MIKWIKLKIMCINMRHLPIVLMIDWYSVLWFVQSSLLKQRALSKYISFVHLVSLLFVSLSVNIITQCQL